MLLDEDRAVRQGLADSEAFLGSWELVAFEHFRPSGEVVHPFGEDVAGLILYGVNGRMSAQMSVRNPQRFASELILKVGDEDASRAWRGYLGYWGTFRVDAEKCVVVHRVEGSWFPNWIGTEQVRRFRFEEGCLILEAEGADGLSRLTWRRGEIRSQR